MKERIDKLISEEANLKSELSIVRRELTEVVLSYKGTIQEAIGEGLIRLNFPAPPGLYKHIRRKYTSKGD